MISTASVVGARFFWVFASWSALLVRVTLGVLLELRFPRDRRVDLLGRNYALLDEAVRDDGRQLAVEEVEHAVVHAPQGDPQLVDASAEVVGFGAPELVPKLRQSFDSCPALEPRFLG